MKTFKEFTLNEKSNKQIAKELISHINSQDFSMYDWDMYTVAGIEEYLDAIEDEDEDAKYNLENDIASIDDIRDALKEVEKMLKNTSKIKKIQDEIEKLQKQLEKLM